MIPSNVIYIVDDDLDDQEFLIEVLRDIDPSSTYYTAVNGQEGLNKLMTNAIPIPSIIFLDLNMPRVNGRKFLQAIKEHPEFCTIPVIIYSTSSDQWDIDEMKKLGATDYLVKHHDTSVLKEKLRQIISTVSY